MKIKAVTCLVMLVGLSACDLAAPYDYNERSQPVAGLLNSTNPIVAKSGNAYKTEGFIELFRPNYFVLVQSVDGRDISGNGADVADVASKAVRRIDCANGTQVQEPPSYSPKNNQWLVVTSCKGGGRSLTGS